MTPAENGLARFELLREFKRRMPRTNPDANVSPFDDRVSTAAGGALTGDLPEMHAEVRSIIRDTISAVRNGKKQSQVILLSGAAGAGKTHLVRTFQSSEATDELGHIFVGGSNHWKIKEFQAQLLDWVIEALTAPSPAGDHLLLDRIRAIGFRAVEHLLTNPVSWKTCLAPARGWFLGKLFRRWLRPSHGKLTRLTEACDPEVFRYFDFYKFSTYVCDRFLEKRSNLLHRYALRVLLTYLFPDKQQTGIGTRERVLHWFRGQADDRYFTKRLGASERPDKAYSQFEAVKLLAHLFSPTVSAQLATATVPCPPRVLLLTFDQAEGRDELFDTDDDWQEFFAHLSELYNSLPNVVVLFTMTLGLRNRLHAVMERQFRDRIRMDEKFTLSLPSAEQVLGLYRTRMDLWLRDDPILRARYAGVENPYLPFTQDELLALSGNQTVRSTLVAFDTGFHQKVRAIAVDATIDYLFERNERKTAETASNIWDYTARHLTTVQALLKAVGPVLTVDAGIEIRELADVELDNVPVLRFTFGLPKQSQTIVLYLARLGKHYNGPISSLIRELLYNREKAKSFLWVVRPQPLPNSLEVVEDRYRSQFVAGVCSVAVESAFTALTAVNGNREKYNELSQLAALGDMIRAEVSGTYLGQLFRYARAKLDAICKALPASDAESVTV